MALASVWHASRTLDRMPGHPKEECDMNLKTGIFKQYRSGQARTSQVQNIGHLIWGPQKSGPTAWQC